MVVDPPRRLVRRRAVPEQVRGDDASRRCEARRELGEVTAPRRDAVQADDRRRRWRHPTRGRGACTATVSRRVGRAHADAWARSRRSGPPHGGSRPPEVTVSARASRVLCRLRADSVAPPRWRVGPISVGRGRRSDRHAPARSVPSDSGTSSVRRVSGSRTSDQMTVPSRSIRNVPRTGAPVVSLKTPYRLAASPCDQKSDANVYSAPSCALPRLARGGRVARHEDDLRVRVAERGQVLLEVERLLGADGRERERVEDEEDVRAAEVVGEPDARLDRTPPRGRTPGPCHPSRSPRVASSASSPFPDGT